MNKVIALLIVFLISVLFLIEIKKNETINYIEKNIIMSQKPYHFLTKAQQFFDKAILCDNQKLRRKYLLISKGFLNTFDDNNIKSTIKIIDEILNTNLIDKEKINKFNNLINQTGISIYRKHLNNTDKLNELKNILNQNALYLEFVILCLILLLIIITFLYLNYQKIKDIYHLDSLTLAFNRNKFYEVINLLPKGKHSLIMLDIDHFKKINDTYGHDFGDMILQKTVEIIQDNIRKDDMVFRWGGEEFIILLKKTSKEDALKVAKKLKKAINQYDFEGIQITSSFGIKECKDTVTKDDLIIVDKALYEAKKKRNEIVCY